jgi:hypothetical protein
MGTMSTKKMKGFYLPPDLIKFIEKTARTANLSDSAFVEMLILHFKNLPDKERVEIIKAYLTKDL